jgi:hypothetical protein
MSAAQQLGGAPQAPGQAAGPGPAPPGLAPRRPWEARGTLGRVPPGGPQPKRARLAGQSPQLELPTSRTNQYKALVKRLTGQLARSRLAAQRAPAAAFPAAPLKRGQMDKSGPCGDGELAISSAVYQGYGLQPAPGLPITHRNTGVDKDGAGPRHGGHQYDRTSSPGAEQPSVGGTSTPTRTSTPATDSHARLQQESGTLQPSATAEEPPVCAPLESPAPSETESLTKQEILQKDLLSDSLLGHPQFDHSADPNSQTRLMDDDGRSDCGGDDAHADNDQLRQMSPIHQSGDRALYFLPPNSGFSPPEVATTLSEHPDESKMEATDEMSPKRGLACKPTAINSAAAEHPARPSLPVLLQECAEPELHPASIVTVGPGPTSNSAASATTKPPPSFLGAGGGIPTPLTSTSSTPGTCRSRAPGPDEHSCSRVWTDLTRNIAGSDEFPTELPRCW